MSGSLPRVVLADDHLLFVKSLERLLEDDADVVRTVGDGRELLAAAAAEAPDVIVCDISMPELDGLEATQKLLEADPRVKVVMLSMHDDRAHVKAAFRAGARAYVVKSAAPDELVTAIRQVLQGHYYSSPAVTGHLVHCLEEPEARGRAVERMGVGSRGVSEPESDPALSPREREVLRLVSQGCSNLQIADRLCVSEATVRSHLSHIYDKLQLSNRVELALYAVRAGLFRPGERAGAVEVEA